MHGPVRIAVGTLALLAATANAQLPNIGLGFVEVGDPGNIGYDGVLISRGREFPAPFQGRGSVDYTYRITRSEIVASDIIGFVNQFGTRSDSFASLVKPLGAGVLFTDPTYIGPGQRYFIPNQLPQATRERGSTGLSLNGAMAYANWLHNGQSSDPASLFSGAYNLGTYNQDGSYTLNVGAVRQAGARFAVPSVDEFLKAAYYDPTKNGLVQGGWWTFAHQSDEPPVWGPPSQGGDFLARGLDTPDPEDGIVQAEWGINDMSFIPRGAFADTASYYGLVDVMGGEEEWLDEIQRFAGPDMLPIYHIKAAGRGVDSELTGFMAYSFLGTSPNIANGFRIVALVPAPSSLLPLAATFALTRRRR